ncbi:MAG: glycosyltransferase family 1 protein [Alphaproteobacteria bacterium]|nr:glycosyltransferase family 1 protein [Alphaproteobacteria bacterium]
MTERPLEKIYFVHEGLAAYPEIAAYQSFFVNTFAGEEIRPEALASRPDAAKALAWHMMGFYPRRGPTRFVLHDYRSLSVGRWHGLKDGIKRFFCARPDLRVFQNVEMAAAMGFRDNVPTFFLPMGVPASILSLRKEPVAEPDCDFCYIGVLSQERQSWRMIDSFLKRFGTSKSFHLYGTPEESIAARYRDRANVVFKGTVPQEAVFRALRRARVAVNYFPDHFPHRLQTPTKLLEYAALGLRVLSNEHPQSRLTVARYGVRSLWGRSADMFRDVPDALDWDDNAGFDPTPLLWPSVIAASGVPEAVEALCGGQ